MRIPVLLLATLLAAAPALAQQSDTTRRQPIGAGVDGRTRATSVSGLRLDHTVSEIGEGNRSRPHKVRGNYTVDDVTFKHGHAMPGEMDVGAVDEDPEVAVGITQRDRGHAGRPG